MVGDVLLALGAFLVDGFATDHFELTGGGTLPESVFLAATGLVALTLLLRRHRPWVPFAVWWVYGLLPLLLVGHQPFAGLLISVATLAARRPLRWSVPVTAAALVPMELNALSVLRSSRDTLSSLEVLGTPVLWALLPVGAWGLGRVIWLLRDREQLLRQVHAAELGSVIRDERLRLARDLHDIVAHSVSAMILQAAGARSLSTETDIRIRTALRSVELTGADAMKELHRLLGLLRETATSETPELSTQPGLANIDQILTTTRSCGVEVELVETGVARKLDPTVSYTAFRMVQECMANVIKHGGAGARSTIEIDWHDDGLDITVRNDEHEAVNASMLSGGYGLRGLTERVQEVGGRFAAGPAEESVFVASMSLPLRLAAGPTGGG